ncbi:hypothetical protein [Myroides sp. N17-2]|uniref:hypothetical protein n=1 Tax=Myroides sp. N17-2 TaxID=2030799 RepID=UPI000EFACF20|nr:hypothetical protein [Myroides sp. N17-2]
MKKVLEGELLSLAHRVLQLKDREVDSLFKEAKELYEKLLILKFYQDHLDEGRIKDVSPEKLDDALKALTINNLNTSSVDENVRHQMPVDLIEEDYPIIVDSEKEAISTIDESLLAEKVTKLAPEMKEEIPVIAHKVMYDEPFITDVYIDESDNEADDAQLHQYLDQHEAMLKQNEEALASVSQVEEEQVDDSDDVEVNTFYGEEQELIEKEEVVVHYETPLVDVTPGVEEHMVIAVEEELPVRTEVPSPVSINEPLVATHDDVWSAPIVHKLEEEKVESIEETIVNINQQFATATIDEPVLSTPPVEVSKVVEERTTANGNQTSSDDPFFGFDFSDVEFVRVEDVDRSVVDKFETTFTTAEVKTEPVVAVVTPTPQTEYIPTPKVEETQNTLFNVESTPVREPQINKNKSINDIYNTTIVVGLNDRIAFERHLFNGSAEDFNRVLSQLNTVSSFDEANSLIEHLIKPEYNNWEGKDEYAERFMALVEKRFI